MGVLVVKTAGSVYSSLWFLRYCLMSQMLGLAQCKFTLLAGLGPPTSNGWVGKSAAPKEVGEASGAGAQACSPTLPGFLFYPGRSSWSPRWTFAPFPVSRGSGLTAEHSQQHPQRPGAHTAQVVALPTWVSGKLRLILSPPWGGDRHRWPSHCGKTCSLCLQAHRLSSTLQLSCWSSQLSLEHWECGGKVHFVNTGYALIFREKYSPCPQDPRQHRDISVMFALLNPQKNNNKIDQFLGAKMVPFPNYRVYLNC